MAVSLLEILRTIPDRRRAEGKRFDLSTVLLYAILGKVAGANSYRQLHEFIRVHMQRLNEAFNLRLPLNSKQLKCEHPFLLTQFQRANNRGVVVGDGRVEPVNSDILRLPKVIRQQGYAPWPLVALIGSSTERNFVATSHAAH